MTLSRFLNQNRVLLIETIKTKITPPLGDMKLLIKGGDIETNQP
jgi:hypothetical protein